MLARAGVKVANMQSTFAHRLAAAMAEAQKTRTELGRVLRSPDGRMGISPSAVGQLLSGASKSMNAENCARAARFLGVNAYWLATGEGPMRDSPLPSFLVSEPAHTYENSEQLLARFGELLGRVPERMRPSFGDVLRSWVMIGGRRGEEDRLPALLQMLGTGPEGAATGKD